ncbi:MAG TPA: DUF6600 domain-containing protein, partial [Phycisphaerales bacterium]|nr:DUF6600 domain-containing protein [Phycisphaerales bacterium]
MCAFLNHSFSHAFAVSLLLVPAGIASAWQVSSPPPPPQSSPSPAPASQPAGTNVSDVSVFYDQLSPYGEWIKSDKYGWVWHPNDMTPGWRPYTLGRWEYSDDCGWLWTSDEPWGWACFHYGRWAWIDDDGWCWTPGTVWGPAWVAWRSGGDCVGWCALPPEVGWRAGVGLDFGSVSLGFEFGRPWCFCDEHNFCDRDIHEHIFVEARNRTMFERTREISRVTEINGRVFDTSVS